LAGAFRGDSQKDWAPTREAVKGLTGVRTLLLSRTVTRGSGERKNHDQRFEGGGITTTGISLKRLRRDPKNKGERGEKERVKNRKKKKKKTRA